MCLKSGAKKEKKKRIEKQTQSFVPPLFLLCVCVQAAVLVHHQRAADGVSGRETVSALQDCQVSTSNPAITSRHTVDLHLWFFYSFLFSFFSFLPSIVSRLSVSFVHSTDVGV